MILWRIVGFVRVRVRLVLSRLSIDFTQIESLTIRHILAPMWPVRGPKTLVESITAILSLVGND